MKLKYKSHTLLLANRKSHMPFRLVSISMTLNDLEVTYGVFFVFASEDIRH